jgi:NTE family protein
MTEDKYLLLKLHPCAAGLTDEDARAISDQCDLLRCDSGQVLQSANEPMMSIYLVIRGAIRQSLVNLRGDVLMEKIQTAGTQVGALAAASGEPTPIRIEVLEPTTLLRIDYHKAWELTKQYDLFRQNLSRLIAESVQSTLMREHRKKLPRLIAIFHESAATRELTRRIISRLQTLGISPAVLSDQTHWPLIEGVPHHCLIQNGSLISEVEAIGLINSMSDRAPFFFDLDAVVDAERTSNLLEYCEQIYWCVTPDNWRPTIARLEALVRRAPNWKEKINIVWLLPGDMPWAPDAPEFKTVASRDFKLSFDPPPKNRGRIMQFGLERIIHEIRGIRIGLALGGGAARGMAHLGVLKALENHGIIVDMVAGTSAGAMTGIMYASGYETDYLAGSFARDLTPSWFFRQLRNGGYWYLLYKYRRGQFDPMLRKYMENSRLEQLSIPAFSVTVDLISGLPLVREAGDAVSCITESINLPVLSQPINRDGCALVDGGIVNNVPANVLVSKGCNFVLAVSVTAQIKKEFAMNRPDTPTAKMKPASILQTIMRTYVVQNVNMNSVGVQPAGFVIQPDVSGFDITEFTRAAEMAAIGEATANETIPQLRKLLVRLDKQLFAEK